MEEDKLREIAKQEMTNAIMNNIDSTLIFTYIKNLEDMNEVLEQENQSYKDYYGTPPCYDNAKYIPKSVVIEKIEELKNELKEKNWSERTLLGFRNRIQVLQELLEGEK